MAELLGTRALTKTWCLKLALGAKQSESLTGICLDCRPHLEHMDKGDGSLRIKGGEWTGSAKPDAPRGEKGALGSPITDDSGFPKTDSPLLLLYGMGSFAPLNVVQKESTQLHLSIIAYSTIAICKFFISLFSSEILCNCPEFKVS